MNLNDRRRFLMEERKRIRCERPIRTAEGSNASCWILDAVFWESQEANEDERCERTVCVCKSVYCKTTTGNKASTSAPPSSAQRSSSTKVRIYKQPKRQERKMTMIIWKLETAAGLHSIYCIISQIELLSRRFSPTVSCL